MTPSPEALSPLRQRMIEDMRMRTRTQDPHSAPASSQEAGHLPQALARHRHRRRPAPLPAVPGGQGTSPITINATIVGLKFFFDIALGRSELMSKMQAVRVPQKLPVVLSRGEVTRLIAAALNLKSQTALFVAYALRSPVASSDLGMSVVQHVQ